MSVTGEADMYRSAPAALGTLLAVGLLAQPAHAATPRDEAMREVSSARVYFGHQSVGWNILDGIATLYGSVGIPAPKVVDGLAGLPASGPGFAQQEVGSNGDPQSKFDDFARALTSGSEVDVAAMKLCYVDITADSRPRAVFAAYRRTVTRIRAQRPGTTLVHVTAPLTVDDPAANLMRQRYNALLRKAYGSQVFDLARVESTRPNGSRVAGRHHGRRYFALFRGYTSDGGHLNARGSKRAAVAFVRALARASQTGPAAAAQASGH